MSAQNARLYALDGKNILIHDSEEGDPDNLVRLTFRFQKPTGLRYD